MVERVTLGQVYGGKSGTGTSLWWKVALGQVFLRVLRSFRVIVIQPLFHIQLIN